MQMEILKYLANPDCLQQLRVVSLVTTPGFKYADPHLPRSQFMTDMGHVDVGQFCECSFKVCTWGKLAAFWPLFLAYYGIFLSSDSHSCISCQSFGLSKPRI